MKGVITIIKIFAILAVAGIVSGLVFFIKEFKKDFAQPSVDRTGKVEKIIASSDNFKRGEREFNRALELIAMEKLIEAREKLLFIQNLHADSEFGSETRRILGEINLDEVLSVSNMTNKQIHTVQPGRGAPLAIANQYKTTLDCIMFLNDSLDVSVLHAGDELIVMPLDFKLVIDLEAKRVELYQHNREKKAHVFTKEYAILSSDLPEMGKRPIHTKIISKKGELNGRVYPPGHSNYRNSSKLLSFKIRNRTIQLRPVPEADEDPGRGLFLSTPDMEELAMLTRLSNEVAILPAQ